MLPKEIKRFEMENLAMESQLPIIQYVLNPGKQVSNVTSNPFFSLLSFLQATHDLYSIRALIKRFSQNHHHKGHTINAKTKWKLTRAYQAWGIAALKCWCLDSIEHRATLQWRENSIFRNPALEISLLS